MSQLTRQSGLLLCPQDVDKETVRQRDLYLARTREYALSMPDMQLADILTKANTEDNS